MTLLEAIENRHSVRKYIDKPIPKELADSLQTRVDAVNKEGNLHIQLITNEPKAFKGKFAYGVFKGVSNYFAVVGPDADGLKERAGYYGEQLVLQAQQLGLNTCWVGLTYNNIKDAYQKSDNEKLVCMIALGYGDQPGRSHKAKTIGQVSNAAADTPQWFIRGVESALKAPTALNQQKFHFEYISPNKVRTTKKFSLLDHSYTETDLGIAKLHFELAAGKENFEFVE